VPPTTHRVNLEVSQDIIDSSCKADSSHCMIADAVRKAVPEARSISVDIQTIRFSLPGTRKRYFYITPRQAQLALLDFDAGVPPEPFKCQLRGPWVTAMRAPRAKNPRPEWSASHAPSIAKANKLSTVRGRPKLEPGHGTPEHGADLPARRGGSPPPSGALRSGAGKPPTSKGRNRGDVPTARVRTFGLRAIPNRRLSSD